MVVAILIVGRVCDKIIGNWYIDHALACLLCYLFLFTCSCPPFLLNVPKLPFLTSDLLLIIKCLLTRIANLKYIATMFPEKIEKVDFEPDVFFCLWKKQNQIWIHQALKEAKPKELLIIQFKKEFTEMIVSPLKNLFEKSSLMVNLHPKKKLWGDYFVGTCIPIPK